jgi:hypothetical protein
METIYWFRVFPWFPKKDMARGGGCIRVWGVTITHIYSTEARVKGRQGTLKVQFLRM